VSSETRELRSDEARRPRAPKQRGPEEGLRLPRAPTKPDEGERLEPPWPSGGVRAGATRASASPHPTGPLLKLRGAPGTQLPAHLDAHGLRPTRTAFRRPPGSREPGPAEPDCSGRRPPLHFRSSSEVHRNTPAPSRRPEGRPSDDASSPGLSRRTTRAGTADPRIAEPPGPAACRVRGLGTPIAASTTVPADALRRRSVHRLTPSRPSPRVDRTSFRRSLPSWRCSRRFASPPRGACGRGRLQGFDPAANTC
jgi:hypothetical protein